MKHLVCGEQSTLISIVLSRSLISGTWNFYDAIFYGIPNESFSLSSFEILDYNQWKMEPFCVTCMNTIIIITIIIIIIIINFLDNELSCYLT